jgi:phosphopentomutase
LRRAFVVVLDACGIGALPDAAEYGDAGADTLGHLAEVEGGLRLPTLEALGLGSIAPLRGVAPASRPVLHGRLHALGPGKDSTAGHWELMGVVLSQPLPTYPDGFPGQVLELISSLCGRAVLCNQACNGLEAIERYGEQQLSDGGVILYTSQDSVLQLATHVEVMDPDELYGLCAQIRVRLGPEHGVGRVIARPFAGRPGAFTRTEGRRDFSIAPPGRSYLEELQAAGMEVHAVGKVGQLFAGRGIDVDHPAPTNHGALEATGALIESLERGLVFTNLIETDQVYGHRHDAEGFHRALREIDAAVGSWLKRIGPGDLLLLTADHGCDVTSPQTDHTREHVPLLASFDGHASRWHSGPLADVGASVLEWLCGLQAPCLPGGSFL